jgi:hypothetical protein
VTHGKMVDSIPVGAERPLTRSASSRRLRGMDRDSLRARILAFPEVEEYVHGGLPAFRIRGKRFATMLDAEGVNLMPGEPAIHAFTQAHPDVCTERWWGRRLAAVRLAYPAAPPALVDELLLEAWSSKAPKRVLEAHLAED